jgi:hypothetical protein
MRQGIYALCVISTLLLTGCMGYRLGGSRPEGVESVYLAAVVNATKEPAIEVQVTHALRQRIQFDGRLKLLNSPGQADAVIEVELKEYILRPIAFRDELQTAPEQYRMRIVANATLKDTQTGEVISESSTFGESRFFFESDLTTSKRNALPVAAQELARFMVDDLVEKF